MSKEDVIEIEGTVLEALPNAQFQVELPKMCIRDRYVNEVIIRKEGKAGKGKK